MKHLFLALLLLSCVLPLAGEPSPAATQEWVRRYIAGLNATSNTISTSVGPTNVVATYELFTEPALVVTNATPSASPVSNGVLFAFSDYGHVYRNREIGAFIDATKTNFVFRGIGSSVVNGLDTFAGPGWSFAVLGTLIAPSRAKELK